MSRARRSVSLTRCSSSPLGFQAPHEQTSRVAVDPDPFGHTALVDARLAVAGVDVGHHRKLERREIGFGDRLGAHRVADLEEPASQCERNSPDRRRVSQMHRHVAIHKCDLHRYEDLCQG